MFCLAGIELVDSCVIVVYGVDSERLVILWDYGFVN